MVFILIALIALFGIITPNFLKVNSLMTILRQVSMIAIAGIGGGLVIIAGGIDISCGSVMSFSTIIAAYLMVNMNVDSWVSALVALIATTIIGYIQGFLITKTKIPPMICGLGIMTAVKGAGYLICNGVSIYGVPEEFKNLSKGELFGAIPYPVIIMIVLYIVAAWFMKKTYHGRHFYALVRRGECGGFFGHLSHRRSDSFDSPLHGTHHRTLRRRCCRHQGESARH